MLVCKNLGTRSPSSPFFPQSNHLSSGLPGPERGGDPRVGGGGECTHGVEEDSWVSSNTLHFLRLLHTRLSCNVSQESRICLAGYFHLLT